MPNLFIDIEARYAKYQDAMARMESTTRSTVGALEKSFSGLSSMLSGISVLAAGAFVFSQFKDVVDQLAALDDAADVTGASVESLSSLLNTLKPSGVGLEQITDLAGKVTRAMAGADEETSAAAQAFAALKVQTKDAAGNLRPVDDVLVDTAKSLANYADGSNKVALAQALLGKSGASYLPILKDLAENERVAASVTAEQAAEADKLDKAWKKLSASGNELKVAIGSQLIPVLNEAIDKFKAARKAGLDFWDAVRQAGGSRASDELDQLTQQRQRNLEDLQRFTQEYNEYASGRRMPREGRVDRLRELIDERGKAIARYNKEIEKYQLLVDSELSSLTSDGGEPRGAPRPVAPRVGGGSSDKAPKIDKAELTEDQKAVIEGFQALVKADEAAAALVKKLRVVDAAFFDGRASAESYDAALQSIFKTQTTLGKDDELDKLAEKWKDVADPVRQYVRELDEVRKLVAAGRLDKDLGLEAEFKIQLKIDDAAFGKLQEDVKRSKTIAEELGEALSSTFGQAVLAGERLSVTVRALGQDLLSLSVRKLLTEPFSEFITQGLKSGSFLAQLSGLFGGGGGGSGWVSGYDLPGRALGGPVLAGAAYMVGERGPEVFVPKSSGVIVPNNKLGGAGVTIVQNITVNGGNRAELVAAMEAAKEAAKREIYESMRRGGAFSKE